MERFVEEALVLRLRYHTCLVLNCTQRLSARSPRHLISFSSVLRPGIMENAAMVHLFRSFMVQIGIAVSECLIGFLGILAAMCLKKGDYYQAERAFLLILHMRPRRRHISIQVAELYILLGRSDIALTILDDLLLAYPSDEQIHLKLCELYAAVDTEKALRHLELYRKCLPRSLSLSLAYGIVHRHRGELETSCTYLHLSLKKKETVGALTLLANNLIDKDGIGSQVVDILERAIQLEPHRPKTYNLLAKCKYYRSLEHPHIPYMKAMAEKSTLPPHARSSFHSTLGQIFDNLGLWDKAFVHFKAMNQLDRLRFNFSIKKFKEDLDARIAMFDRAFLATIHSAVAETSGESLIFVVGMPRSGTSLLEQILASHPEVHGGGERRDVQFIVSELCRQVQAPYPSCVRLLNEELSQHLAKTHLLRVSKVSAGRARFVDKMFCNWFEIGFIATLFPRARFVHSVRNALDTCVSCFISDFAEIPYTHDLKNLGKVYRHYERTMAHWHCVLPNRIYDVQYETLVEEPEAQIRKLLEYCNLPWHQGCLSPHQTQRPVFTLSATQVKNPISSRSVGRWRNYRKHLGPLMDGLGISRSALEVSKETNCTSLI
jgi:tetratricopeptide (TPR) repeat protein